MKEIIYNYDFLTEEDINNIVIRTKALIINDGYIYLGNENGVLQFPGGHLEDGESYICCLKRELLEETGIVIDNNEISALFLKATYYNKDYPSNGINQKAIVLYYFIETNKELDLSKVKYTEREKNSGFKIEKIFLEDAIDYINNNSLNKIIATEMVEALKEYIKRFYKNKM